MSQQVQELIDKIKTEGIQTASQEAENIKSKAQADAKKIISDAKAQAEQIISEGKSNIKKQEESTQMALRQASRDALLSLRKEIEAMLHKVAAAEVGGALSADRLGNILTGIIKGTLDGSSAGQSIEIAVNKDDLEGLKKGFLAKLQEQVKNPIELIGSGDVGKGFTISFDGGKSSFEFTDESLSGYLSTFLNAQVAELLK